MERPHRRRPDPQIPVDVRRDGHRFLESLGDLDAVVESVRLVVLRRRRGALQPPRTTRPDVRLTHRPDRAGHEQFLDLSALPARHGPDCPSAWRASGSSRRSRESAALPRRVGERLLTVDVFAVGQCQIGGEGMGVLGGADHDRIESLGWSNTRRKSLYSLAFGNRWAAASTAFWLTSQRTVMFSAGIPWEGSRRGDARRSCSRGHARRRRSSRCSACLDSCAARRKFGTP